MAKMNTEPEQSTVDSHSTIIQGTEITGDLSSASNLRFDGTINGTLSCSAKIVIGKTGLVHGSIRCKNADIYGAVEGDIFADELSLKSSAMLKGDIITKQLSIEPGCQFSGNCNMKNDIPSVSSAS